MVYSTFDIGYEIVDRQTGKVVGTTKTLKRAMRSVDRRDEAYGASRFFHRKAALNIVLHYKAETVSHV